MTRWNLVIPEKTDRAVRTYLARTGGKKGDLSKFVDEAVRRYLAIRTEDASPEEKEAIERGRAEIAAGDFVTLDDLRER